MSDYLIEYRLPGDPRVRTSYITAESREAAIEEWRSRLVLSGAQFIRIIDDK